MTLTDLARHLDTAAGILAATAKYVTELSREIER